MTEEAPQASAAEFAPQRGVSVKPEVSGQLKDSTNGTEDSAITASYRQGELIFLMLLLGCLVGFIAFVYDGAMELSLKIVWKVIPGYLERKAEQAEDGLAILSKWGFLYTMAASIFLATAAGASIKFLGFPGDLPDVVHCVHKLGYVPMCQTLPMICCSLFSIAAGGSLGPEAPLVAVSASVSGYISMHYFNHDMVMVRKCTIIGMSAGLSAFFGVQLGGALFALEVLHTMGMQFFDVAVYAIGSGGVCLAVYRGLQGDEFGVIWSFPNAPQSTAAEVIGGAIVGAIAGGVGIAFRSVFRKIGKGVSILGLGHFEDTESPIILCALGGLCVSVLGVLVPPSMFWAEFEMGSIAEPGKPLPHIWPQGGVFYGLERYPWESGAMYLLVGLIKLLAIAFTVQSGFRGGFIFPLFFAGASFGRALLSITDDVLAPGLVAASPALLCMCFAAGLNVAVTRTPFASPLILAILSGQPNVMAPALCAALASLFVTRSSKFIGPQRDRADLQFIGDLQPLELPPPRSASSASQPFVCSVCKHPGVASSANGNGSTVRQDEETGSLKGVGASAGGYNALSFQNTISVEDPLPDDPVRSEGSMFRKKETAMRESQEEEEKEEEEEPITASYRQGELIKMMILFGCLVGLIAFLYDGAMELSLKIVWKVIPGYLERKAEQAEDGLAILSKWGFLYTMAASIFLATAAGASIKFLGFPGDLPDVVHCVHELGYVPMCQTLPMICCSLFSIAAGGSLGPEAPLVAVSASVSGYISMYYFRHDIVMVRKCTIIGMSAGLSAFFGVQLGGALFALEVLHTMGMQFFDVAVYAIGSGGVCLAVYRGLQGEEFGQIWPFPESPLSSATEVILGAVVGAMAGGVGIAFRSVFRKIGKGVSILGLGHFEDTKSPIILCALGGLCVSALGVLVPPSMFWAEFEIGSIAEPGKDLPHIWPQGGVFYGLERYPWESGPMYLLVGLVKLLAIACTVQSGFRGGFIFPLFFAGASFGRALLSITDDVLAPGLVTASPALLCMCFAAGLNVAVTRTPFASPLILVALSGQPNILAPALCAALASLFVTRSSKFIGPQRDRADLQFIGDLQPLELPPPRSASSASSVGFQDNLISHGNGHGNGRRADPEAGKLLTESGPTSEYSAIPERYTEQDVARAIKAALQTEA
ncbi:unnamed protein product [Ectocarpus sp. 6 AP-2014]